MLQNVACFWGLRLKQNSVNPAARGNEQHSHWWVLTVGHAWTEKKKSPARIRDLCKVSEDQLTVGEGTPLFQFTDGKSSFATGIFSQFHWSFRWNRVRPLPNRQQANSDMPVKCCKSSLPSIRTPQLAGHVDKILPKVTAAFIDDRYAYKQICTRTQSAASANNQAGRKHHQDKLASVCTVSVEFCCLFTSISTCLSCPVHLHRLFMSSDYAVRVKQAALTQMAFGDTEGTPFASEKQTWKRDSYLPFFCQAHAKPTQKGQPEMGTKPTTFVPTWEITFMEVILWCQYFCNVICTDSFASFKKIAGGLLFLFLFQNYITLKLQLGVPVRAPKAGIHVSFWPNEGDSYCRYFPWANPCNGCVFMTKLQHNSIISMCVHLFLRQISMRELGINSQRTTSCRSFLGLMNI